MTTRNFDAVEPGFSPVQGPPARPEPVTSGPSGPEMVNPNAVAFTWNGAAWTWGELLDYYVGHHDVTYSEALKGLEYWKADTIRFELSGQDSAASTFDLGVDEDAPTGGGGRGRASSAVAPVYVKPDEGAIHEMLRPYVVATVGYANAEILDGAVKAYLASDKDAWDKRETESIDPSLAAKDFVRNRSEYKAIHALRPDSVDELDWVSSAQGKLRQLGVSADRAEKLGIAQATAGATNEDLVTAAQVSQVGAQGQLMSSQRESLKRSISAVARMVK